MPIGSNFTSLVTYFAFYKSESAEQDYFRRISEVQQILVTDVTRAENNGGVNTMMFPLSRGIYVEEMAIIGACVSTLTPQLSQVGPLHVVSENVMDVDKDRLLVGSCDGGEGMLPDRVGLGNLISMTPLVLHIHATVGKTSPCMRALIYA